MNEVERFKKICTIKKVSIDAYILDALRNFLSSGELDLSGYPVSINLWEVLADVLSKSQTIKKLKLCDCMIPPLGFEYILNALMNNNSILEVDFYGNVIDSDTTATLGKLLAANKSIKILILHWNNIGRSLESFSLFCDGLSKNKSLEHLDLRNNQICSSGASSLSSALRLNCTLKFLDLRWNKLKNKGVDCIQNAMQHNKSLQEILVKGNFVHIQQSSNIESHVKKNEEMINLKKEYDLRIEFLLKELKQLEDLRVKQMYKITRISQQRFSEMGTKFEEMSRLLLQKEKKLRNLELQKKTADKELNDMRRKISNLEEEMESLRKKNRDLEKALDTKHDEYSGAINEIREELQFEKQQNAKLLVEIKEKNTTIEDLKDNIVKINLKWEALIREKTVEVENLWKIQVRDVEDKLTQKIADLRGQLIEREVILLKEEELKLKDFRNRAEEAEKKKLYLEAEISSLKIMTGNQQSRISELEKEIMLMTSELGTTRQNIKIQQAEIEENKKALNKANGDLSQANETIDKLKIQVLQEKEKVNLSALKMKEVTSRMSQMNEEEKLRSELLVSALRRYLRSSGDSHSAV